MRMFLKGTAIALALAGAAVMAAGTADAAGVHLTISSGDRHGAAISVGFSDVAFAYRDGYWDNSHHWHHWRNSRDSEKYRSEHADKYHNWNHDRDSDNGWKRH
jgi:hypothetical protein